ncbi:hypothetical protein QOT17_012705 [Balamuthia mandrillaris]
MTERDITAFGVTAPVEVEPLREMKGVDGLLTGSCEGSPMIRLPGRLQELVLLSSLAGGQEQLQNCFHEHLCYQS